MIVVVLDQPQDLVNIAQVVRGMKNFGLRDLRLVRPVEYDRYRIEGIAHKSGDVLARVQVHDTLDAAIADCVHVVGTTARGRTAKRNWQRPEEGATELVARADGGTAAVLFGREDKGLSNDALDRCHRVVTIPTNPAYPSLNLAHAAIIMLYAVSLARGDAARPFKAARRRAGPAAVADVEKLFRDAEHALDTIAFFKTRERDNVLRTVREVVHRAPLDQREAKLLSAIAIEVAKYGERLARSRLHVDRE